MSVTTFGVLNLFRSYLNFNITQFAFCSAVSFCSILCICPGIYSIIQVGCCKISTCFWTEQRARSTVHTDWKHTQAWTHRCEYLDTYSKYTLNVWWVAKAYLTKLVSKRFMTATDLIQTLLFMESPRQEEASQRVVLFCEQNKVFSDAHRAPVETHKLRKYGNAGVPTSWSIPDRNWKNNSRFQSVSILANLSGLRRPFVWLSKLNHMGCLT